MARSFAGRIKQLGFDCWMDEEKLRTGDRFPPHLEKALDEATHLLAILSPRWYESRWAEMELQFFTSLGETRDGRVIGLLPERILRDQLPLFFQERTLIEAADFNTDEIDWCLYCAVTEEPPGARKDWPFRVRQVRAGAAGIVDFNRSEIVALAKRIVVGKVVTPVLAANAAVHCVRIGLSPRWLEVADTGNLDLRIAYRSAIQRASDQERPFFWTRIARVSDAKGEPPEDITERDLVELLITSRREAEGLAALQLLSLRRPTPRTMQELCQWIDPDTEPDGPQPAIRPQSRGYLYLVDAVLGFLFEQSDVDPCSLFRGMGSALMGEAHWWECYFGRLLNLATDHKLSWEKIAARFELGLQWAEEDVEQLIAICRVLSRLSALPMEMLSVCQNALNLLRFRRGARWSGFTLRLCELLLQPTPYVVFIHLGAALPFLSEWVDAQRGTKTLGLSAQEEQDLLELLHRFHREVDPERKALLFESAMESPADVVDFDEARERLSIYEPVSQALALAALSLHYKPHFDRLGAAIESKEWIREAPAAISHCTPEEQALWPYVLGREYFHADIDVELRWLGLQRCFLIHIAQVIQDARPFIEEPSLDGVQPLLPTASVDEVLDRFDQALGPLLGLGRDITKCAVRMQSQLRWLRAALRDADRKEALQRESRLLVSQLDAWFAAVSDVAQPLTARSTPCYRYSLSCESVFVSVRLLLENEEVKHVLRNRVYPQIGEPPEAAEKPLQAMHDFSRADDARSVGHRLLAAEQILTWMARLLCDYPLEGGEAVLWALLRRSHGVLVPGATENELHSVVIKALAKAYQENPSALYDSLSAFTVDIDTRVRVLLAAYDHSPEALATPLLEALRSIQNEPGLALLFAEGIEHLGRSGLAKESLQFVRSVLSESRDGKVLVAAAQAILGDIPAPSDIVSIIDLALREPDLRPKLSRALDRIPAASHVYLSD